MSVLRVRCRLNDPALGCEWVLVRDDRESVSGESNVNALPRADRVHVVVPAADVTFVRAKVPVTAGRRSPKLLAYAVEEETLGNPEDNRVIRLGTDAGGDVFAVLNARSLGRWQEALAAAGVKTYTLHAETLLAPWHEGEWSLVWNGNEGFVRTGRLEGVLTDRGERTSPPLALSLLVEDARSRGVTPSALSVYLCATPDPPAPPDVQAWQHEVGLPVRLAGDWDWRTVPLEESSELVRERARWASRMPAPARLRPAAWLAGIALVLHGTASVADWARLAREDRALRQQMVERFRAAVPDAVAVVDPALQMRRKLAEARHEAGLPDAGDFLPLLEKAGGALAGLPAGVVRSLSYENATLSIGIAAAGNEADELIERLRRTGLRAELRASPGRPADGPAVIVVRPR